MDENKRRRTVGLSKWGRHPEPNFTIRGLERPLQQKQSETSVNHQHLDQFLSGIRVEREKETSNSANANTVGKTRMPMMNAPLGIRQGTPPPGLSLLSDPRLCRNPFPGNSNRPPFWQNPPPEIVDSKREQGQSWSEISQSHCNRTDVARNATKQDAQDSLLKAEALPPVPLPNRHHVMDGSGSVAQHHKITVHPRSQFSPDNSFGHSQFHRPHQERYPSGPQPSGPHPSGLDPTGPDPSGQLHPSGPLQPTGPHPPGPHPPGPQPPGPHPPGPHPPGPHPPGPHPSGLHPSGPHLSGLHPSVLDPFVPHPSALHPSRPHPSRPHPSGPHPPGLHPPGLHPPGLHPPGLSLSVPLPNGPHPSEHHPPGSHPFGQHPPEPHPTKPHPNGPHPTKPNQSAQHQSGRHPFGPPGRLSAPSQVHPFHPHQQHQVQNRPNTSFPGPHRLEPHPAGPRPHDPQFTLMFPTPAPQQRLHPERVTAGPFSGPDLDRPAAPPSHRPFWPRRFPEPHPFSHPQEPEHEKSPRERDEEWVTNWLRKQKIGHSENATKKKQKPITLEESRQLVRDLHLALHQLKEQTDMLDRHTNKDESSWQYECRRANRTKERVETLKTRLFSKGVANKLEYKLKKAIKKRARVKRHRFEKHQLQQDVEARRKEIHLRIDAELAKRLHAEQEKKREAELQEEVDKTLYEVRKKKQEVSQALELIKGLKKLRLLRKEAAQAKGVITPRDSDMSFEEKLKPLEELMGRQSILYREEERVMQVMLEEEHEEYKEQEKRRQRKRLEEKAIKDMQTKMKLLFGKDDLIVRPDDPMHPFQQFYMQAENNIHALVDIRHQWDQFLVPDEDPEGLAVPVPWVLPEEPSSDVWAAVLDS